jgi:hypothetical protein
MGGGGGGRPQAPSAEAPDEGFGDVDLGDLLTE